MKTELEKQVKALPESPGVYQYFNSSDEIIYVGKAKNLKRRVNSYFNKVHESDKTSVLVKQISHLKYITVETEADALLLENNLIKRYQPRYNVLLKDGKTYPSICVTNEAFPRVFKTRNIIKNGSKYFGPYSSNYTVDTLIEFIHQIFPIRTCKLPLTKDSIEQGKFKVCLQYHIKKCNGPCENLEKFEDYNKHINSVIKIINGDANDLSKLLLEQIKELSSQFKFEEAHLLKLKFDQLENFKSKSIISNTVVEQTDIFGYDEDESSAYVNILRTFKGSIIQGYTIEYKKRTNETKEDILASAIYELRGKFQSESKEIIIPFEIEFTLKDVKFTIPQKGDKRKLLDLSTSNVKYFKLEKLKQTEKLNPEQKSTQILKALQDKLHLKNLPMHIECFDNSNISGSSPVAACVVFIKAKPAKKEYRKYHIKTVDGPDDYASMREIVYRRYKRLIEENKKLPDLIITDGGIGHMESVRQIIVDELKLQIPIAGLAKNDKHKTSELLFGFPPVSIGINLNDILFKFLSNIQDEVHRFAINFHKDIRSKKQIESELDNIRGIGSKTKTDLMKHFRSIKNIQNATLAELEKIIANNRASIIYDYFLKKRNAEN